MASYYVGLDLGQSQDPSALAIVEEPVWVPQRWTFGASLTLERGWVSPATLEPWIVDHILSHSAVCGRPPHPPLSLRHLMRFPLTLGVSYLSKI